jgi:hypothetical protein
MVTRNSPPKARTSQPRLAVGSRRTPKQISRKAVTKLFEDNYENGPIPSAAQSQSFKIALVAVLNQPVPEANNSKAGFRRRLGIYNSMLRLVQEQKKVLDPFDGDLRLPSLLKVEKFEKQLEAAKEDLLHPYDPQAGLRKGAEWHKPARYLACKAEEALRLAGHKRISKDKHGPFIGLICDALVLAGQDGANGRAPETVAAALAQKT